MKTFLMQNISFCCFLKRSVLNTISSFGKVTQVNVPEDSVDVTVPRWHTVGMAPRGTHSAPRWHAVGTALQVQGRDSQVQDERILSQ